MDTIPAVVARAKPARDWSRHLPAGTAFTWLGQGWRDFATRPASSLAYGLLVFVVSAIIVSGLIILGWDYILFPAFAGFMVIGPILALGLYEKSRRLAAREPVSLGSMLFVHLASGGQVLFTGVLLCLVMLLWWRAAVIIYALFFGLVPFPGLGHIVQMLTMTPTGWGMVVVGGAVGAIFASFGFAISAFSIPMLLERRVDALTAMGSSVALVWHNLGVMLTWGAIVLALFLFSLATALVGLIIVFPVLGHGTWAAWRTIQPPG